MTSSITPTFHDEVLERSAVFLTTGASPGSTVCIQLPDDACLYLRPDWAWELGRLLTESPDEGALVHVPPSRDRFGPTVDDTGTRGTRRDEVRFYWESAPGMWQWFRMSVPAALKTSR